MFENFFIQFEQPMWLWLALLILPAYLIARRSIGGLSPLKTHVTFAVRAIVIVLLTMALARPSWIQKGEGLSVIAMIDRSRSIPTELQRQAQEYMLAATTPELGRQPEDRLGIITIGEGAAISALPNRLTSFADNFIDNLPGYEGTNLAEGVRLAMATTPEDTAIRFVIISDGNETEGDLLEAVKIAKANNIPIDVLPMQYELAREVVFDRIVAPARAREGQVTSLRMVLRAQGETSGMLTLRQNGVPVDLDPGAPGEAIHVSLAPGLNPLSVPILFDQAGPQSFDARFEPDDPATDLVPENNNAVAVTFVGGEGRVLILNDAVSEAEALGRALEASDLSVIIQPASYIDSPVTLSGFDAVIMMNQHRGSYTDDLDRWLHDYVHDLGGGLIVTGGPQALGAGGWINSKVEDALPLKLDPPQNMQRQKGALALIMHSCEMAQANYWGQKVAIDAINALSSLDVVGILDYNWNNGGCVWEFGPAPAGDKTAAIAAAQKMPVGDMPDFDAAMQLAHDGLVQQNAKRHSIIISDGDPSPPSPMLLQKFVDAQITVTTVLIAGHGGPQTMQNIANTTRGNFYNVTNPTNLPEIFISEARLVARSLTLEGDEFIPMLQNSMAEPIRGFRDLPSVDGYVLTAPKPGLAEIPFVSDKHGDPLYANWNYGIGKAIVFTPDLSGLWGSRWVAWDSFKGFWDQSVRWAMRPVSPANMTVNTRLDGDRAIVEVEAYGSNAEFLNNLNSSAAILGPGGTTALPMQQVGPGKYRGEFMTSEAGPYLINMHFTRSGEPIGNIQAAVNVPYAREYRTVRDNQTLLVRVAEETGGRLLPGSPELADLWDRTGLEARKSHKPIWDLLAILAATIFILDVAGRRLSIGASEVRKAAQRLFGKRDDVASDDTMAAWKKARSNVAHRRTAKPGSVQSLRNVPVDDDADKRVKFEADEANAQQTIDVAGESSSAGDAADATARARARQQADRAAAKEQEQAADAGDYTSRLLAARRRAREQQNKPPHDPDGGS